MTDDTHETLARSLFSSEGKKPVQRRRAAKSSEPDPSAGDPDSDRDPTHSVDPDFDLAKLQAAAQAWEEKYHQAQTELETLRPQLQTLQAQLEQQAKLIQEQQAAITFWQQKAQAPTPAPPTLPTRPHQTLKPPLKPLAVPPTPSQPHAADPLPDFMLD